MIDQIKKYYDLDVDREKISIALMKKGTGDKRYIVYTATRPYFLICGVELTDDVKANPESYLDQGIIKITGAELYHLIWNEEACLKRFCGFDMRTKNYIESCKKNVGFLRMESGWDGLEFTKDFELEVWINTNNAVECGRNKAGEWVAQYGIRTDIDDYTIFSYVFNRKPDKRMILDIEAIYNLEISFARLGTDTFKCWECGRELHWLNVEGTLKEKISALEENYCGC